MTTFQGYMLGFFFGIADGVLWTLIITGQVGH
jgi:hypothetical protein